MRYLLPSLLFCACQLPAEDAIIQYGGHEVTVTLPAPLPAALSGVGGARAHGDSHLRLLNTPSAVDIHDALLVCVQPGVDAPALAQRLGLIATQGQLPHVWRMTVAGDVRAAIAASTKLRTESGIVWVEQEVSSQAHLKIDITPQQWHLVNDGTVIRGGAGNDLNVAGAWAAGASGQGVNIAIIDTGLDLTHPDLVANLKTGIDRDVIGNDDDPSAEGSAVNGDDFEAHGTVVASVAAARGDNGFGVTGVAYRAGIIGVRLITPSGQSNSQKATALGWLATDATLTAGNRSDVLNNSWGPGDGGIDQGALSDDPSSVEKTAMAAGVTSGRGGKGAIYIFASGNGRGNSDIADFDGYASNRLVMAIGASNGLGQVSSYSEGGFCLFANATVGETSGIVAADRQGTNKGFNLASSINGGDYTTNAEQIVGTSFAAPQAAGVVALLLEKNPNLTWRDVRHLIARTAVKIQPGSSTWRTLPPPPGSTTALHWSPDFGFGRIDATAAVALADPATWVLIPAESAPLTATKSVQATIPDGASTGIGGDLVIAANAQFRVETVEFAMSVAHANQSQLTYTLISPAGTRSTIVGRPNDTTAARTRVFTSLGHWGEGANGTWRVEVADRVVGTVGTLGAVSISVYGYIAGGAAGNTAVSGSGSSTAGLIGSNDPSVTPPPAGGSTSDGDSSGGLCGLGSGSVALLLSGFIALMLRRNLRA